jgi:ribosomal protein S18 acetylase RimI-like enzyme
MSWEMPAGHYTLTITSSEAYEEQITNNLVQFNNMYLTQNISVPLHIYALDKANVLVGGLIGKTLQGWDWLEIGVIWVHDAVRGQGLGRQLVAQAEAEACKRGCHYARLSTWEFQARGFYEKLGYNLYGQLDDYPREHTVYYFRKALD